MTEIEEFQLGKRSGTYTVDKSIYQTAFRDVVSKLNSRGPVKSWNLSVINKKTILKLIQQLYSEKTHTKNREQDFGEFIYDNHMQRYGLK